MSHWVIEMSWRLHFLVSDDCPIPLIAGKYGVQFNRVVNERRFIEWVDGVWRLRANSHTTITPLLS